MRSLFLHTHTHTRDARMSNVFLLLFHIQYELRKFPVSRPSVAVERWTYFSRTASAKSGSSCRQPRQQSERNGAMKDNRDWENYIQSRRAIEIWLAIEKKVTREASEWTVKAGYRFGLLEVMAIGCHRASSLSLFIFVTSPCCPGVLQPLSRHVFLRVSAAHRPFHAFYFGNKDSDNEEQKDSRKKRKEKNIMTGFQQRVSLHIIKDTNPILFVP